MWSECQTGNNLRLSLQSQSSVSGTVYRLPISVYNVYLPGSRPDTTKIMHIRNTHYTKSKQKPKQTQNNAYSCEYALVAGFSDKKLKINIFHYNFYIYLTKLSLKHT